MMPGAVAMVHLAPEVQKQASGTFEDVALFDMQQHDSTRGSYQCTCGQLESRGLDWGRPWLQPCLAFLHWRGQLIKLAVAALQGSSAWHHLGHMLPEVALAGLDCEEGLLQGSPLLLCPALPCLCSTARAAGSVQLPCP